jgi:hypothetical protein
MCILMKNGSPSAQHYGAQMALSRPWQKVGLHQPDLTGYKWRKGLHQPLRFRPARPHGVKCAYWCWSLVQPRCWRFTSKMLRTVAAAPAMSSEVVSAPVRVEIPRGFCALPEAACSCTFHLLTEAPTSWQAKISRGFRHPRTC